MVLKWQHLPVNNTIFIAEKFLETLQDRLFGNFIMEIL